MRKESTLYIAYGSNLNIGQVERRCPGARILGASRLEGWRMLFRGDDGHAVATLEPYEGGSAPVLVWAVTPEDEAALDRYEGWPNLYRKTTLKVELGGKPVSAMIYLMNPGRPLGQPSPFYYATILEGYNSAGFDPEILRRVTEDSVND